MRNPNILKQWLVKHWLKLVLTSLGISLLLTGLLSLPMIQKIDLLNSFLDFIGKICLAITSIISIIVNPTPQPTAPTARQECEWQLFQKKRYWLGAATGVFVLGCLLLALLWYTRERIIPADYQGTTTQEVDTNVINLSAPPLLAIVQTGKLTLYWQPMLPKYMEFYRKNASIEKSSNPVLSGSSIHLNKPGEVEIKLWSLDGPVTTRITVVVVGYSLPRTLLIFLMITLFIVAAVFVWISRKYPLEENK